MSQNKTVLNHLKRHGSITSLDAILQHKILRLAARINDLREMGYNIQTIMIEQNDKRFAKYVLDDVV